MKYAKDPFSQTKILATPKAQGICFCCDKEMVAKCGEIKIHHWAHKRLEECDHWWENETEWHRKWKDRFPEDWQEVVRRDLQTGQKHIADVYNPYKDLVVEFQNSPIKGHEIQAREKYYKRMLWVLNGAELNFLTIPIAESSGDFAKLETRVRGLFFKLYREAKIKVQNQISILKGQSQDVDDHLTKGRITSGQWLRKSKEIDKEIALLQESLERKKEDVEARVHEEFAFQNQYAFENLKREYKDRYVIFDWRYKNPSWNDANRPIFVDYQNELFLLKTRYVAVAVPLSSFLTKYRSTTI